MSSKARIGARRWNTAALLPIATILFCARSALCVDLIGYLPYYRMNAAYDANVLPGQLAMLSEIRYFGLTVSGTGAITPLSGSGTLGSHKNHIQDIKQAIEALPEPQRPRLNITLGGAGEAANFATIAADSALRTTLAQNVASLLDETGATSIDTDWEHPANNTQLNNYALMLQSIKQAVGEDRRVYATVDPTKFVPLSVFDGTNGIDGISLMTYELAWWANDSADLNRGEHSLPEYVTDSVDAWTDPAGSPNQRPYVFATWGKNADETTLGIGLPFFGRGIGTVQNPQAGTAYTYAELSAGGTSSDGNYYSYQGKTVWIPGQDLAEQRVEFAHDRGLDNIIIWELGQDLPPNNSQSLLRRAFSTNQRFAGDYDGDGLVAASDYDVWRSTFGYTSGDMRADGNNNGVIDATDYAVWRRNLPASAGNGSANNSTIPEPSNVGLLMTSILWVLNRRACGQRR